MKDILIGLIIIIVCFFVIDFIYTEKHVCKMPNQGYTNEYRKCGFIKEQLDLDIYLFDRYW